MVDVSYGNGKYVAVACGSNNSAYSTDGIKWSLATLPAEANWFALCYGNGLFITFDVGNDFNGSNRAAYSTDGIKWKQAGMSAAENWVSICYGGD